MDSGSRALPDCDDEGAGRRLVAAGPHIAVCCGRVALLFGQNDTAGR